MPVHGRLRRRLSAALLAGALTGLAGCAQPPRQLPTDSDTAAAGHWSGRLALQVQDAQNQSFSAAFELQGSPRQGELLLFTPLGSTLARLQWNARQATLEQGADRTTSDSLPELVQQLTGSALPVAAVFDWLQGRDTVAAGWEADLSDRPQGRLIARRHDPLPPATLRIVLDTP